MEETLWSLFWTTGLPEAYALAKKAEAGPDQREEDLEARKSGAEYYFRIKNSEIIPLI